MPDTIAYYNQNGQPIPYDSLPEATRLWMEQTLSKIEAENEKRKDPSPVQMLVVAVVLGFVLIKLVTAILKTKRRGATITATVVNDKSDGSQDKTPRDYYVYEGSKLGLKEEEITSILVKHYPFYNGLWPTIQYRFQQRLYSFINSKSFIIYSQEPYKEMPVLASAAAIHLTLGLDEYMLPWFNYICIHQAEYFAADSLRVLAGNVKNNVITLAFNQLLKGIKDGSDGVNVGLHEMAHALYYQEAVANNNKVSNFSEYFEKVMQEGEEVYQLKDKQHVIYTDYAYRNLQEFWAESVEIFFEKPADMQRCYPEIYETIKGLLKQNPLNKENPLC